MWQYRQTALLKGGPGPTGEPGRAFSARIGKGPRLSTFRPLDCGEVLLVTTGALWHRPKLVTHVSTIKSPCHGQIKRMLHGDSNERGEEGPSL